MVGHLKFMQLLLNEIFEKVKTVPKGKYRYTPYDATSSTLDGRKLWHHEEKANESNSCFKHFAAACCGKKYDRQVCIIEGENELIAAD